MFGEKIAHGTPFRRAVEEGLARRQAGGADRPARHGLRRRGFRLAARARLPRRPGRGVLVQVAGAADGGGARAGQGWPGLYHLRHRRARPRFAPGTGTPETARAHQLAGDRDHPRLQGARHSSAATSSKSRHPTTPAATPRCWRPGCCSRCSACCRACRTAKRRATTRLSGCPGTRSPLRHVGRQRDAAAVDPGDGQASGLPPTRSVNCDWPHAESPRCPGPTLQEVLEQDARWLVAAGALGGADQVEIAAQRRARQKVVVDVRYDGECGSALPGRSTSRSRRDRAGNGRQASK